MSITKLNFNQIKGAVINVQDYGASALGTSDCASAFTSAIAAVVAAGGGILFVPKGTYRFDSAVTLSAGIRILGEAKGSNYGTYLVANNTTAVFTATSLSNVELNGLIFKPQTDASGTAWAYYQTGSATSNYTDRFFVRDCAVWGSMEGGFYGNFILSTFDNIEFGNSGSNGASFTPISSIGDVTTLATNANLISNCYILNSKGTDTIIFNGGSDVQIRNCRFETCLADCVIRIKGLLTSNIDCCYFENCNGASATALVRYSNDTSNTQGCKSRSFTNNFGALSSNNTSLISSTGAAGYIVAYSNTFGGMTGKNFDSNGVSSTYTLGMYSSNDMVDGLPDSVLATSRIAGVSSGNGTTELCTSGNPFTLFTITVAGLYKVYISVIGQGPTYTACADIAWDGTGAVALLSTDAGSANIAITISGVIVKGTQSGIGTQTISYTYLRIGT